MRQSNQYIPRKAPPLHTTPATLIHGEALAEIAKLPTASVDALITDPPYSSGGLMRGDRQAPAAIKYVRSGAALAGAGNFTGDNRDQRAFTYWETLWLSEALRVVKPGGVAVVFTDWRQLPATTDALQAAGRVWRGIIPWVKTSGRPQRGGFRNQAEYAVWGSNGPLPKDSETYQGGWVHAPIARGAEKQHITAKPLEVMAHLVEACPEGGLILDPFAGSSSTGVAALAARRRFLGIELNRENVEISRRRLGLMTDDDLLS